MAGSGMITRGNAAEVGGMAAESSDTRLIAAVHAAAGGARCHEAANLVQAYCFSLEVCRHLASRQGGPEAAAAAAEARQLVREAKGRLRNFLAERLLGWIGDHSPERRLNRDHLASADAAPPLWRPARAVARETRK